MFICVCSVYVLLIYLCINMLFKLRYVEYHILFDSVIISVKKTTSEYFFPQCKLQNQEFRLCVAMCYVGSMVCLQSVSLERC